MGGSSDDNDREGPPADLEYNENDMTGNEADTDNATNGDNTEDTLGGDTDENEENEAGNEERGEADATYDQSNTGEDNRPSSSNVRGVYDQMSSAEEILNLADGSSMPGAREKATPDEIMMDPFTVIGHILLETCCGQKNNFHEAKHICAWFRQNWARVCARAFWELSETANTIHNQQELEAEFEIQLER